MKNGNNDFLQMLHNKGAIPLRTDQEIRQQAITDQVAQVFAKAQHFDVLFVEFQQWFFAKGLHIGLQPTSGLWTLQQTDGINVSQHRLLIDALRAAFAWVELNSNT